MNGDWALQDLTEISSAIAQRRVTAAEVTQACLERIHAWQPAINCFLRLDELAARESACACDQELARGHSRGPLHGVPMAHKDLFYRAGRVSTGGSLILREHKQTITATVLQRLDAAGAIDLGSLHMTEFASGPTGHNVHFGHCRNVFNRDYMASGSSSGSATAVAARLVFGALGSDTGGSIRLPAAANGVTGLKPTYGRVSRHGVMPRAWSIDHVGPIARSARDCACLLQIIAGPDPNDPTASSRPVPQLDNFFGAKRIEGTTIGIPGDAALSEVHPEVAEALGEARRTLEQLGAKVQTVPFADWDKLFYVADTIIKCEAASLHRQWMKERKQDYAETTRLRFEAGLYISATQYIDALRLRTVLAERFFRETMAGIDVLFLPLIPFPVPTVEETDTEGKGGNAVVKVIGGISRFTQPVSLLGLPAISVPCGFCRRGLPIAFQLVGHPFDEATLLRVTDVYQQATEFHRQVPTLQSGDRTIEQSDDRAIG